jgi:HK97 family phage portal protein
MNVFNKIGSFVRKKSSLHSGLTRYHFDNSYFFDKGKAVWMERDYKAFATEAYMKNVIAHRSIDIISQGAASVPFKVYTGEGKNKKELSSHPVLSLLKKPNPMMNGKHIMQSIYSHMLIQGNAYLLAVRDVNKPPYELIALRPDRVHPLSGEDFMPSGYRYVVDQNPTDYLVNQTTGISDILHLKTFHPLSDWFGLSPIEAAAYSIDQHNQSAAWNQSLLQNGARPSGALVVKGNGSAPGRLTDEQFQRLKQSIDECLGGSANAGRPLLLEGGLEWQEMSLTPKDMDFIETKHSAARDIALAFGVPPQLLGIPGDNTYSNLVEARIALWEQTIIPMVDTVVERLGNWLKSFYNDRIELAYDIDNIPALSAKREAIWARIDKATFMTDDEKRAAVGLTPSRGNT